MTDTTPAAAASRKSKHYSEAFKLKCTANRAPDPATGDHTMSVVMLAALDRCDISFVHADAALAVPTGTVREYLLTANAVCGADGAPLLDDTKAFAFITACLHLVKHNAFGAKGLYLPGVLSAMMVDKPDGTQVA